MAFICNGGYNFLSVKFTSAHFLFQSVGKREL